MLFLQIMFTSSTYKALHTPWCLSILVGRVSLAEYLLVLRVLFPLLQITLCFMATARTVLLLPWMRTRTMGNGHSVFHLIFVLLVEMTMTLACIKLLGMLMLNYFASATFKLGL